MLNTLPRSSPCTDRTVAPVAIARTAPQRVFEDVYNVMEMAGWRNFIPSGADVSLKPNLGWDKLIPGSISAPWVVEAVIVAIRDYVGEIYLVESDQEMVDVEDAFLLSRLDKICREHGVKWVNMSQGKFIRVQDADRLVLRDIRIPEILARTELITLPLLKTHNKTTITGAIKNQWGCLETLRHSFHLVLSEALVDVNSLVQPRFAVMDGTVGLEGNGPKSGSPKEMNVILASGNLVGLDATAASLVGFDPHTIEHLVLCAKHGLGSMPDSFDVIGVPIEEVMEPFLPARHNVVSWLEFSLRKSFLRWLAFETPIFRVLVWGSRRYYDLWDWWVGNRIRKEFFARSLYARQWR
jgi:uncharacterized protein (DUF362 family)